MIYLNFLLNRQKVLEIIQSLQKKDTAKIDEIVQDILALQAPEFHTEVLEAIQTLREKSNDRWYMLSDLWDYIQHWEGA